MKFYRNLLAFVHIAAGISEWKVTTTAAEMKDCGAPTASRDFSRAGRGGHLLISIRYTHREMERRRDGAERDRDRGHWSIHVGLCLAKDTALSVFVPADHVTATGQQPAVSIIISSSVIADDPCLPVSKFIIIIIILYYANTQHDSNMLYRRAQ